MPGGGGGGGSGSFFGSLAPDLMQLQAAAQQPQTYGTWSQLSSEPRGGSDFYASGIPGVGPATWAPPPELARYFGPFGEPRIDDPRTVAAEGGISLGQLAGGLLPRTKGGMADQGYEFPSDRGGFFKIEDVFGLTGRDVPAQPMGGGGPGVRPTTTREGAISVPQIATFGMGGPSTNNWRLLGREPGWIMRNNMMINTKSAGGMWGYPASAGPNSGASGEQWMLPYPISLGTGAGYGMPNLWATGIAPPYAGWPGAETWFKVGGVPNAGMGGN